jgi:hypothetical protein
MAVGGRTRDCLGGDLPLGARSILDDEWLVETRRQPLTNQAREDVGRAAGRKADQCALSLNFQLKNAPLWALGFICPRVHVSALSDRLGSELGVGFLHHRQRPCARRRWLRDPSRSRLYKVKEPQMSSLFFTCPTTRQQAPTGIETDVQSLRAAWKATLNVKCPHCGEVHEISVRETYINGALKRPISLGHLGGPR